MTDYVQLQVRKMPTKEEYDNFVNHIVENLTKKGKSDFVDSFLKSLSWERYESNSMWYYNKYKQYADMTNIKKEFLVIKIQCL